MPSDLTGSSDSGDVKANTPDMIEMSKHASEAGPSKYTLEELLLYNRTDEATKLVNWIKTNYNKCRDGMASHKAGWNTNLSFYKGDQYVDRIGNNVVPIPAPKSKVRMVVNRVRPHVRTEVARLTSMEPTAEVVPASSETSDIESAKAAEALWVSTSERLLIQRKIKLAVWWASITGTGYVKTWWNPDAKETYPDGQVAMGDYGMAVPTPYHVMIPNQLVEDIEDQPYVINAFAMPLDQVQAIYSEFFQGDYKPNLISTSEIMDESRLNTKGSANDAKADSCLVIEVWIKPGNVKLIPKGGMVTLVDEKIVGLSTDGLPYKHGQYPFTKIDNIQSGGYFATSAIDDIIPLQRELNKIRSDMIVARTRMANPGLMYRQGTIDPRRLTNDIGRLVEVKGGGDYPQPIPQPTLPPSVMEEHNQILADIEDITGQHQVSKGTTPTGVTAATAIELLQEQDNSYLSTTIDSVEAAAQKIANQIVQLFIQYADSERQIKIVGKDKAVSVKLLMGADLKTATDIRIERGSSLPYSKAARTAQITDWMSRGLMDAPTGFDMMDLAHFDDYYDIVKVDQRQAERENLAFLGLDVEKVKIDRESANEAKMQALMEYAFNAGYSDDPQMLQDPQFLEELATNDPQASMIAQEYDRSVIGVNDYDNHEAHLETHNRVRKSQEYETADPAIREELDRHCGQHEQLMQAKAMEDMFMQGGQAMDPMMNPEMDPNVDPNADPNAAAGNQFSGVEEPVAGMTDEMSPGMAPVDTSM